MKIVRGAAKFSLLMVTLSFVPGCSINLEAHRPAYHDMGKIQTGVSRSDVVSELGPPDLSDQVNGKTADVYSLDPNGRYAATKAGLIAFHLAADIFTAGMWEAVATPAEKLTQHSLTKYEITYSASERVESVRTLTDDQGPPLALTLGPHVAVGRVVAIYARARNLNREPVHLGGAVAVNRSNQTISDLDPSVAGELAGGPEVLAASLSDLPSALASSFAAAIVPGTRENQRSGQALQLPVAAIFDPSTAAVVLLLNAAFDVSPSERLSERLRSGWFYRPDAKYPFTLDSGQEQTGYIFFPKGDYRSVSINGATAPLTEAMVAGADEYPAQFQSGKST